MLNSIIERHNQLAPLSNTEIKIVQGAIKLFLEKGFSQTTQRMIAAETGIGLGTITYHYHSKEDLLKLFIEELMDYHLEIIEDTVNKTDDKLLSYALEIAVQIALCDSDLKAKDLYFSAYRHPATFDFIKKWAAKKNYFILGSELPHLKESDFVSLENITSGIELASFTFHCNRYFTLDNKISLVLNSIMKIYDITEDKRNRITDEISHLDCTKIGKDMFDKFIKRFKKDIV